MRTFLPNCVVSRYLVYGLACIFGFLPVKAHQCSQFESAIQSVSVFPGTNVRSNPGNNEMALEKFSLPGIIFNLNANPDNITGRSDAFEVIFRLTGGDGSAITWASFETTLEAENVVRIHWATSAEINSVRFDVQRSSDGTDFHTITSQTAAGNSERNLDYYAADHQPFTGTNFYRIRSVDLNGTVQLSEIRRVETGIAANLSVTAYPNPTSRYLTVVGSSYNLEGGMIATLCALDGRPFIETALENLRVGNYSGTLDLVNLQAGTYILTVQQGAVTVRKRITKI